MFQKKKEIFSNLNNFKENEIDINEEEYLWVKKRNERLKKNQNKENNKENKENENINNKIERFLSPKKEILNEINENIIITRREIKQEQQQEEEANNKANNKENKDIKTPSKSESKNNDNKKSSFKQQKQQKQEEQEEQQEVDQDIPVSIPSPSIQRSLSKLSIHSFSDSKESTPRSEKKYIINEDKESIQLTPKPLSSKKFKSPEIKQAFEQIASSFAPLLDSGSESDSEVIAPEIDNYKLQQEMLVEQLFSKVRHNRQQQVIQILRNGFDSNLTVIILLIILN